MHPIRKYRDEAGLSQQELGAAVGLSRQQVWRIERGDSKPSADSAAKLSAIIGVPAWDIMRHGLSQ